LKTPTHLEGCPQGSPRHPQLLELLQNQAFISIVRLFLLAVLSLAGYIWSAEVSHINRALDIIRSSQSEGARRQWEEVSSLREEVSGLKGELNRALLDYHQTLRQILELVSRQNHGR